MTDHPVRLCVVALLFLLSISILACSGNQSSNNGASPTIRSEPPTNSNASPKTGSAPASYEGYFDIANCDAIIAWGWDMTKPNDAVKLDIYDGNFLIGTGTADVFRQDLHDVGKGNGKHSMYWPIPVQMKDGKKHVITVKFAGTSVELGTSPKDITCNLTP